MASFQTGNTLGYKPGQGGRVKGARNKISLKFLEALAADFEQYGEAAIKLVRLEKPAEYVRIVASILPKEFDINETRLHEIDDATLDILIQWTSGRLTAGLEHSLDRREREAVEGEQTLVLQAIPQTT
jgi:hypothetical protein